MIWLLAIPVSAIVGAGFVWALVQAVREEDRQLERRRELRERLREE